MWQELERFYTGAGARGGASLICKIARKTIPRCGIGAMLFLCMGFSFLFPACQAYLQIAAEKSQPCVLRAGVSADSVSLEDYLQIAGVERVSPVICFDTQIAHGEHVLNCQVQAVYSSFLELDFVDGVMYPDSSNMPYLVLNLAAADAFTGEEETTVTVAAGERVILSINGKEKTGAVCGIFDDGSESPAVYMSYATASKDFPRQEMAELLFSLTNKGLCGKVLTSLGQFGVYGSYDTNETLRWELLTRQVWQSMLTGAGFLICAAVLTREKRNRETVDRAGEISALLLSGMTEGQIKAIFPLRLILAEILCLLLAAVLSQMAGTFSSFGLGACLFCAGVHCVAVTVGSAKRHTTEKSSMR